MNAKTKSPLSGAERQRRWRLRLRGRLIQKLGGKCAECGSIVDLEFDHLERREWKSKDLWSDQRVKRYEREAAEGKLQLLCGACNKAKGQPGQDWDDEEPF